VKWIKSGKHNGKKNENDKRQLAVGGSTGSAAEQRATRKGRQRSTGKGERIKRQQQQHLQQQQGGGRREFPDQPPAKPRKPLSWERILA
jgi:hypothetical protein